jgi:hypothetical protein
MGDVLNKAPEQRPTCRNMVGSFLRLLPSIWIRYAQQKRMGEEGKLYGM